MRFRALSIDFRWPYISRFLGNFKYPIFSAVPTYFSIERPSNTGMRPISAAASIMDFILAIWDENVVTITPDPASSVPNSTSDTKSAAIFSDGVLPLRSELVLSVIIRVTPSFPICRSRSKSGASPIVGVRSILKSFAYRIVPSGVCMAAKAASIILCCTLMSSIDILELTSYIWPVRRASTLLFTLYFFSLLICCLISSVVYGVDRIGASYLCANFGMAPIWSRCP